MSSSRVQPDRTRLKAACACDIGKRRSNNEDNFLFDGKCLPEENRGLDGVLIKEFTPENGHFFAVFDGMGGCDYGEVASYTAAKKAKKFWESIEQPESGDIPGMLVHLCRKISADVFSEAQRLGTEKMGATIVCLYFLKDQAVCCNLGDSRGFVLRKGELRQVSTDHTDAAFMKENGIRGRKPYLTQYLGVDPEEMKIVPSGMIMHIRAGDCYLLCSDGLTDMVPEKDIEAVMKTTANPREIVEILLDAALRAGGRDNITVIAVKAPDPPQSPQDI